MPSTDLQFNHVEEAFTRQSVIYDENEKANPTLKWMREKIRKHALAFLNPGDKMLELNGGTGTDAIFFAQNDIFVHSIDISGGMIEQIKKKVNDYKLSNKISFQQCSYTELNKIINTKFDFIFSNFGGLNCLSDLGTVTKFFPALLKDKGKVCLVVMPPVCPWELIKVFSANFKFAFRRLKSNGAPANIEGIHFTTYYFNSKDILKALGKNFELVKLEGIAVFTPIPQMEKFPKKFPRLSKFLNKLDEFLSGYFPFNRIGDHLIITAQYSSI